MLVTEAELPSIKKDQTNKQHHLIASSALFGGITCKQLSRESYSTAILTIHVLRRVIVPLDLIIQRDLRTLSLLRILPRGNLNACVI